MRESAHGPVSPFRVMEKFTPCSLLFSDTCPKKNFCTEAYMFEITMTKICIVLVKGKTKKNFMAISSGC